MDVRQALRARKSVRAFLDRPVPRWMVERVLDAARHAPSGANTQPWQVIAAAGSPRARIAARMRARFESGEAGAPDYPYYPERWFPPYDARRRDCGMRLYSALGIRRDDREARRRQWARNYDAFGAPVMLFFFLDRRLATGSFIDCGMFMQSLMLSAVEMGLATCPQAALAEYPDIVREELGVGKGWLLVCGMALGYEDPAHPVNGWRTPREPVSAFARFHGFVESDEQGAEP
ncbi:MAG: nitroreductase [Mariprofundaceae bacterium]